MSMPVPHKPPGKYVVLYDGQCKFCTASSKRLLALAQPGAVEALDFQQPGVLERFPGITYEACMKEMQLITPDGRVYHGFEAAVRALATRRILGMVAFVYYLPVVRQLCDLLYRFIAARRYRIMGRAVAAGECAGGTCALHLPPRPRTKATSWA
jgi:predicted DCC family thiol-disulfide oxidoreductase YuxK